MYSDDFGGRRASISRGGTRWAAQGRMCVVAALLVANTGCGTASDTASTSGSETTLEIGTSPSGALVVHNPGTESRGDLEVGTEIGGFGAAVNEDFGQIQSIAVDGFDRVYVADSYSQMVRVFGPDGTFVRALGQRGQGPGEFAELHGLAWQGDSLLWVSDIGNGRYSVYDTAGLHVLDVRRPAIGAEWPWHGRFDADRLIEANPLLTGLQLLGVVPTADGHGLTPRDTFPDPFPGLDVFSRTPAFVLRSSTSVRMLQVPFAPTYQWVLDGHGGVWTGDAATYTIVLRRLAGDTAVVISNDWTPVAVVRQERDDAIAALGTPDALRSLDLGRIPHTKPAFAGMMSDARGDLWVLREGTGSAWFVEAFDRNGRKQAVHGLPLPPDQKVVPAISDRSLWLVTRDTLGVQRVVRLAVSNDQ